MKSIFLALACIVPFATQALEVEKQFENQQICVLKILMNAGEELGFHRDERSRVVIGLQGGTITRIEQNGTCNEIVFPTGKAVFLEPDPVGEQHRAINKTDKPIEVMVVQFK